MASELHVEPWGQLTNSKQMAHRIVLRNEFLHVVLTDFGARLISIFAPDRGGNRADVVLGYDTLAGYEADKAFHGATCGRFANRIRFGEFRLDGKLYQVPVNDTPNALHGGPIGFDQYLWQWKQTQEDCVEFQMVSPSGDQGFPGKLNVRVRYKLDRRTLRISYHATTTETTVVNLTNHSYFNLSGDFTRDVLGHEFRLSASHYLPISNTMIPTGELAPVENTPFDFRRFHDLGPRLNATHPQLQIASGIDHTFVLDAHQPAAFVQEPSSGRTLSVETSEPGIQFYTGNFLRPEMRGKAGIPFAARTGFCLETQHFPDSPNQPAFPSTLLQPGEAFTSTTSYTLGVF